MKHFLFYLLPLFVTLASCAQKIIYTVEKKPVPVLPQKQPALSSAIVHRDGRCFKTCTTSDRYETRTARVTVYTGFEADAPVRTEKFLIDPSKTRTDIARNGAKTTSTIPAVTREVRVLADTTFYRDFRYETIQYKALVEKGGGRRETEVVCSDERTPNLYLQISNALKSSGYLNFVSAKWSQALSEALQEFQKDHGLSVGDVSVETLQFMGI